MATQAHANGGPFSRNAMALGPSKKSALKHPPILDTKARLR